MLFDRIREVVRTGTSVIYITHRLAELRQIAQRVTVLRDGRVRGGGLVDEIGDADLLSMIVGRTLGSTFPPKSDNVSKDVNFSVKSFSGRGFHGRSFRSGAGADRRRRRSGGQWPIRIDAGARRASAIRRGDQSSGAFAEDQASFCKRRRSCLRTGIRKAWPPASPCAKTHHLLRSTGFPRSESSAREGAGPGRRDVQVAGGQDAEHRSANPFALRRQPAKGCHVARPAVRAGPYRCRRADAGRRRRRAL